MECFKCKFTFPLSEMKKLASGKNYCQNCVLASFYRCEYCGEKFLLGDFGDEYNQAKKLA